MKQTFTFVFGVILKKKLIDTFLLTLFTCRLFVIFCNIIHFVVLFLLRSIVLVMLTKIIIGIFLKIIIVSIIRIRKRFISSVHNTFVVENIIFVIVLMLLLLLENIQQSAKSCR